MLVLCRRFCLQLPLRRTGLHGTTRNLRTRVDSPIATYSAPRLLEAIQGGPPPSENTQASDSIKPIHAYRHLRLIDRAALANVPLQSLFNLMARATSLRLLGTLNQLVQDLLQFCPEPELPRALHRIMSTESLALLPPKTLLLVVNTILRCPGGLDAFSVADLAILVRTFADSAPSTADTALAEILSPHLFSRLESLPPPQGDDILSYTPPPIVNATFAYIEKLLHLSDQQWALKLFQFLVNSGNIPSEAVQTIPGLEDFVSIIRSSLVRASSYWHWGPLAERFLSPLLSSRPSDPTISLTIDTIYASLVNPSREDLAACRSLIKQVHVFTPVPNGVFRQFYEAAMDIDAGFEAYALYSFSRTADAMESQEYPCPRGRALPWLISYLLKDHSHLAKNLGQEILTSNIPVAVEHRARIVAHVASCGHAILARTLWTKFAAGRDRKTFVGNPSLILRAVSLFQHLVRRGENILARDSENKTIRHQVEDEREFSTFVLEEFVRVHEPLQDASHEVLASLARAYFIVGRFMEGFETFRLLLDRRDMPDLHDVNIILTAVAVHDPREAAKVIQRMIARGLEPDHVTYGTVMHRALEDGDHELANEMVERVRDLQQDHISYKSIVSLVRGSLASEMDNQSAKLQTVWRMIRAIDKQTIVSSPHLGKYLVYASLRAEVPVTAFRFWEYLLREKTLWTDLEQIQIRARIISALERHRKAGWLKERPVRAMIGMLSREHRL
ncbi:hypothetical protein C8F01DRAFT_1114589 [Mycena amicta]|nr:hypothetical protein C8F01DRAFT_1114589 [Mycena amicta]